LILIGASYFDFGNHRWFMELFQKILKTAVAGEASDVHLKTGNPVVFRIHRELLAIDCPCPTEEWMSKVVSQMTPAHLKTRLEQEREIDFSYFLPGIGRFRTNLFQQRGHWCLAMRKASNPQALEMNLKGIFLDEGRRILN
jgi:twitching motility protein PilT